MQKQFTRKPLAAAIVMVLASPVVFGADPTPVPAAGETTLSDVEVRAGRPQDDYNKGVSSVGGKGGPTAVRDIPQSVTVINRAQLDAQGAASLSDALRTVPGITLGAAEGGQIGNNINLRGFTARTDIYLDGFRDRGQYYRDTFYLDSVEVLKGPSSMLFGRGSTGGVINQVSKQPTLTNKNEVSVTVGTDGYYRATADTNHALSDTSALRIELMGQEVSTTRDVMENKDYGMASSLRFGIGTPTELTFSALVQHNRDMPDYGFLAVNGHPLDVDKDKYYALTDDRTIQDVASLGARVEHKFSPTQTLRNQTQYSQYKTDVRETYPNSVGTLSGSTFTPLPTASTGNYTNLPLNQLYLRLASHDRVIEDESLYNQTDLTSKFDIGAVKHTVVTGLEIGRDDYENQTYARNNLPIISISDPAYLSTPSNSVTTTGNLAKTQATSIAAYVNDTVELDKQWKLVGGVRRDRYKADITNSINRNNTAGNTTLASADQTIYYTSLRAGVLYQPTDTQSYYISYGTSFNPSLEQLTLTTGQQNLDPEKNRSYEIGGKWDVLGGGLSLTSALFQIEKTNARSQVSTGVYTIDGDVRVNGIELGATGRLTSKWQVVAGYTYLDAEIVQASTLDGTQGKVPANTPRNSAMLWTTYNLSGQWETGGGVTYMSNRYASNTNVVSVGDYMHWDATVAYHRPKYDLRLNLLNLTDRRDFVAAIPSDGGRAVPSAGRTALMTATYKF